MIVALVVTNLLYVVGAIVLAAIIGAALAIRHRRPKSVEANVASFNKGLKALAPDDDPSRVGTERPSWITRRPTVTTRPGGKAPVEEESQGGSVKTAEAPSAEEADGPDAGEDPASSEETPPEPEVGTEAEDDTDDGGTGTEEASTG